MWYRLICLATHIPNLLKTKENIENDQSINIYKNIKSDKTIFTRVKIIVNKFIIYKPRVTR